MGSGKVMLVVGARVRDGVPRNEDYNGLLDGWEGLPECPREAVVYHEESGVVGVVAAGVDMPGVPAVDVVMPVASAVMAASARWMAFAAWAMDRGVTLPAPQDWLVPVGETMDALVAELEGAVEEAIHDGEREAVTWAPGHGPSLRGPLTNGGDRAACRNVDGGHETV